MNQRFSVLACIITIFYQLCTHNIPLLKIMNVFLEQPFHSTKCNKNISWCLYSLRSFHYCSWYYLLLVMDLIKRVKYKVQICTCYKSCHIHMQFVLHMILVFSNVIAKSDNKINVSSLANKLIQLQHGGNESLIHAKSILTINIIYYLQIISFVYILHNKCLMLMRFIFINTVFLQQQTIQSNMKLSHLLRLRVFIYNICPMNSYEKLCTA